MLAEPLKASALLIHMPVTHDDWVDEALERDWAEMSVRPPTPVSKTDAKPNMVMNSI